MLCASYAHALGTPAGTPIANNATVAWNVGPGTAFTANASTQFLVDELVQVTVTLQSVSPVAVTSPDANRQLAFLLTNTGNGNESFTLALNAALAGDQFDPTNARIYLDTNGTMRMSPASTRCTLKRTTRAAPSTRRAGVPFVTFPTSRTGTGNALRSSTPEWRRRGNDQTAGGDGVMTP
jgi:hypothetical protein